MPPFRPCIHGMNDYRLAIVFQDQSDLKESARAIGADNHEEVAIPTRRDLDEYSRVIEERGPDSGSPDAVTPG
jgi:hypothetical protein